MSISRNWSNLVDNEHIPSAIQKWLYCEKVLTNRSGRPNLLDQHIFFDDGLAKKFFPEQIILLELHQKQFEKIEILNTAKSSKTLRYFANKNLIPMHPAEFSTLSDYKCLTTSSFRSLFVYSDMNYTILKCSLPYELGHQDRKVISSDLYHSVSISNQLSQMNYSGAYFDESAGLLDRKSNRAVIERQIPTNLQECFWCPIFALFTDVNDNCIFDQIFKNQTKPIDDFIFEDFLFPLVNYLYDLVFNFHIVPGAHAQNLLIELNDLTFKFEGFCFRDFGDTQSFNLNKEDFFMELSRLNSLYLNNTTLWYLENWSYRNNGPDAKILKDMINTAWGHLCSQDYNCAPPQNELNDFVDLSGFYQEVILQK